MHSNPPCSRISTVIVKIECDRLDSLFMRVLATLRFFCPTLPELAAARVQGTSKHGALLRCLHDLLEVGGALHDHVRQVFHEHTSLWMVFQLELLLRIFREQISDPGNRLKTRVRTSRRIKILLSPVHAEQLFIVDFQVGCTDQELLVLAAIHIPVSHARGGKTLEVRSTESTVIRPETF